MNLPNTLDKLEKFEKLDKLDKLDKLETLDKLKTLEALETLDKQLKQRMFESKQKICPVLERSLRCLFLNPIRTFFASKVFINEL